MSDTPETSGTPQVDPVLKFKFNGADVAYDLTKAEDRARLTEDAQLGRFSQKQTGQVNELKQRLTALESSDEFKLGKQMREYLATDPVAGSTLAETYRALQERRVDPERIRRALVEQAGGDANELDAQARASGDPHVKALLTQLGSEIRNVQRRTDELATAQERRELDAAIRGTLSGTDWLRDRPMAASFAERRTRELLSEGHPLDLAATQALRDARELVNEAASAEAKRLAEQKATATVNTSAGMPAIGEYLGKKVDPKAKAHVRAEQRSSALKDLYRSIVRQAEGSG